MNLKAEKFKAYIAENNITNFKVEESINNNEEENARVTFHTYVKVFGQKLPAVIVMDESIYVILRVQVIPDIEYMKNKNQRGDDDFELVVFDLYDIIIDFLEHKHFMEKCYDFEKKNGME